MEAYQSITDPFKESQNSAARTWRKFQPEFDPREDDVAVLEHWSQSGFTNTDLDSQLKQSRIQKIIFIGHDSKYLY